MPFIGSIIPASVAGLGKQVRRARRKADEVREEVARASAKRGADGAEIAAPPEVGALEPSEHVPANESELSREDHEAALHLRAYTAKGTARRDAEPRIDLEG
jgi:hypothetical protein